MQLLLGLVRVATGLVLLRDVTAQLPRKSLFLTLGLIGLAALATVWRTGALSEGIGVAVCLTALLHVLGAGSLRMVSALALALVAISGVAVGLMSLGIAAESLDLPMMAWLSAVGGAVAYRLLMAGDLSQPRP